MVPRKAKRRTIERLEPRFALAVEISPLEPSIRIPLQDTSPLITQDLSVAAAPTATAPASWQSAGPTGILGGQSENVPGNPVSGAIQTLLTHPTNANIVWVATVNGGLWKTTNATASSPTWVPLTDESATLSIGALHLDPTVASHNTLWAGAGRFSSLAQDGGARAGLFKSVDGGSTWSSVTGNGAMIGKNVSGIAARGSTVIVSVNVADAFTFSNVGIFRSTNGGSSFVQVNNGAGTGLPAGLAYDLVSDPVNTNVLYTTIWAGPADGVYKSVDRGATWSRVSSAAMNALIGSGTSNMEMSVGKHNNVYVGIINQGQLAGLFRSGNGGSTWTQLDSPKTNENGNVVGIHPRPKGPGPGSPLPSIAGGQGGIHFSIAADPVNPNVVYVGGDRQPLEFGSPNSIGATEFSGRLFRVDASRAPGNQFISLTHNPTTTNNSAPHADSRDMAFAANGWLIEVDDGGIYRRTNPGTIGDWFGMHGNLQNTEIHSIAYDSISNVLIAGTQDVGTPIQRIGSTIWDELTKGDGGFVEVDSQTLAAQNRSIRYSAFVRLGGLQKTTYNSSNQVVGVRNPVLNVVGSGKNLFNFDSSLPFYTPIVLNAVNPSRGLVLSNNVYETSDQFENLVALAGGTVPIRAFAYGGSGNEDVIYVGNAGGLFVRTSAVSGFSTISGYAGQEPLDIALDPDNWQAGYVVDSDQVFQFTGAGASVIDVTGNLQSKLGAAKIRTVAYLTGAGLDGVVVGTDIGTFLMETTSLRSWEVYGADLPNAPVMDLRYNRADNVLIAGTLGRGAWKIPNASATLGNQAPTLLLPSSILTHTEGGSSTLVGTGAVITDVDSANFATGVLNARVTNGESTDRLTISNTGGVTTNAANEVRVNGILVGTFTGGIGNGALLITFNSAATPARVQTIARSIAFSTVSNNPSTIQRLVSVRASDGDGATSIPVSRKVNVVPTNDKPVLTPSTSAALSYTRNSSPGVLLLNNIVLSDPDSSNLAAGTLTIDYVTGANGANRVGLSGRLSLSGNNLLLDGTTIIGTRNTNGGIGTTKLVITFNASATVSVVQLLLRSVRFSTIGATSGGSRQIRFQLTDGDGGTSTAITRTVNVS